MFTRTMSYTLGIALLSLLLSFPARAQKIEVGTGIFCDTQKQVERFDRWRRPFGSWLSCNERRSCELIALVKSAPNRFVQKLEQRVALAAAKPWGVQLASGFSKDDALKTYARSMARLGAVLEGRDPSILSTVLLSRGTRPFYQVRIGTETRKEADGLCEQIRRAGGACLVLRNEPEFGPGPAGVEAQVVADSPAQ
jgi:sporulation related protein